MKNSLKIKLYIIGVYIFWLGIILILLSLLINFIHYIRDISRNKLNEIQHNSQYNADVKLCICVNDDYFLNQLNEFFSRYKGLKHTNIVYINNVQQFLIDQKKCTVTIYDSSSRILENLKDLEEIKNKSIFTVYTKYQIDNLKNYQDKFKTPQKFINNLDSKTNNSLFLAFEQSNFKNVKTLFNDLQTFFEDTSNRHNIQIITIFHHYPTGYQKWYNKTYEFTTDQKKLLNYSDIKIYTLNHALTNRCSQNKDSLWLCGLPKSISPFLDFDAVFLYSMHTFDYDYNDLSSTIQFLRNHQVVLGAQLNSKEKSIITINNIKFTGINIESHKYCANDGDYPTGLNCNFDKLGDINLVYLKNYDNKKLDRIIHTKTSKSHTDIFFVNSEVKKIKGENFLVLNANKSYTILIYILNKHIYILI